MTGLLAQLQLDHEMLLIRPTLKDMKDLRVEPEYWVHVTPNRRIVYLSATTDDPERFEALLLTDPTVSEPLLCDRFQGVAIYRMNVGSETIEFVPRLTAAGGRLLGATGRRDGWHVESQFPDRDSLSAFVTNCRDASVSVSVDHLHETEFDEPPPPMGLTDRQREFLRRAYEGGYFEIPREMSQQELADEMGMTKSAISQLSRRATKMLCESTLEVDE